MSSFILKQLVQKIHKSSIKHVVNPVKMLSTKYSFNTLSVTVPKTYVYQVELNRPHHRNAQTNEMWTEMKKCFDELSMDPDCRIVIVTGAGKMFTAGLDFNAALQLSTELNELDDIARKAKFLRATITMGQNAFSSMEDCNKPVLAAVHNACIGAGVSLITGADIRYCTKDAWFQVKEVQLGLAADVGVLQRLPKVVGFNGFVREILYTGRKFTAEDAVKIGLVTKIFEDKESMIAGVLDIAEEIASNSPVAVQATKQSLLFSQGHSVKDGLENIAIINQGMLQSEDFATGVTAVMMKEKNAQYSKL